MHVNLPIHTHIANTQKGKRREGIHTQRERERERERNTHKHKNTHKHMQAQMHVNLLIQTHIYTHTKGAAAHVFTALSLHVLAWPFFCPTFYSLALGPCLSGLFLFFVC